MRFLHAVLLIRKLFIWSLVHPSHCDGFSLYALCTADMSVTCEMKQKIHNTNIWGNRVIQT